MNGTKHTRPSSTGIWSNITTVRSRVGEIHCLVHDQHIGRSLRQYGEWAQIEIARLLRFVKPNDFVLDVGANVGFHSLSFARKVGKNGQVWAFEPDPLNGLLLRLNILQTRMERIVTPFDVGISNSERLCKFRSYSIYSPANFGNTGVDAKSGNCTRLLTKLDSLELEFAPSLIKIDIEGHELSALQGMHKLLEQKRPVVSVEADDEAQKNDITNYMAGIGYDVYDFTTNAFNRRNFNRSSSDIWDGRGYCSNLLCVTSEQRGAVQDLTIRKVGSNRSQMTSRFSVASTDLTAALRDPMPLTSQSTIFFSSVRILAGEIAEKLYKNSMRGDYSDLLSACLKCLASDNLEDAEQSCGTLLTALGATFARLFDHAAPTDDFARREITIDGGRFSEWMDSVKDHIAKTRLGNEAFLGEIRNMLSEHVHISMLQQIRHELNASQKKGQILEGELVRLRGECDAQVLALTKLAAESSQELEKSKAYQTENSELRELLASQEATSAESRALYERMSFELAEMRETLRLQQRRLDLSISDREKERAQSHITMSAYKRNLRLRELQLSKILAEK